MQTACLSTAYAYTSAACDFVISEAKRPDLL